MCGLVLAPGGILILCEVTDYLSWYDITTGLIEGWQLFEDGLRDDHPLLETRRLDEVSGGRWFHAGHGFSGKWLPARKFWGSM